MQNNIIEFIPRDQQQEQDLSIEKFLQKIAPGTDQIILVRVNKEGNISLGHSPLAIKDLIVMYHQINRYIQVLLESQDDMYVPQDQE